jgi:hypothetical protein
VVVEAGVGPQAVVVVVRVGPKALEGRSREKPEEAVVVVVVVGPKAKERVKPVVCHGEAVEVVVVMVVMAGVGLQAKEGRIWAKPKEALLVSPGGPSAPNPCLPQSPHWALSLCVAVMVE